QEDLDFVSCENDRYESEIFKWKNDRLVEAIAQEEFEFVKETYEAKARAHRIYEEAEQMRLKAIKEWQKYWVQMEAKYEKERLERRRRFESEQAKIENQKLAQVKAAVAEEKRKREEALKAAENAKKIQDNVKTVTENNTKNLVSDEILKQEERYRNMLKSIQDKFSKNSQLKSATTETRKNITLGLNILTNGRTEILKIASQFDVMLKNHQNNSDVYYFLINYIAKGVVVSIIKKHAEVDVVSKEPAAFPFAHLCVLISTQHAEFMEFLMTRLVKKCPYVLPRYHIKQAVGYLWGDFFVEKDIISAV
ncbi:10921_t:CDS:2, partial [Racocetra fulgida]